MPTLIPPGHNVVAFTFNVTGSTHNVTVTHAATNGGLVLAANILAQWMDALCGPSCPFAATSIATGYERVLVKVTANAEGELRTAESFVKLTGAGTNSAPSMNTAVLVNKVTGIAGRKYRGRMFCPPFIAEANIDPAGTISTTAVNSFQALWNTAYTNLTTNANPVLELQPVLLHGNGDPPTPVTSWQVSQRVGTIGRRMRR